VDGRRHGRPRGTDRRADRSDRWRTAARAVARPPRRGVEPRAPVGHALPGCLFRA